MFGYLQATNAHDFILAIHIDGLGQYVSFIGRVSYYPYISP